MRRGRRWWIMSASFAVTNTRWQLISRSWCITLHPTALEEAVPILPPGAIIPHQAAVAGGPLEVAVLVEEDIKEVGKQTLQIY